MLENSVSDTAAPRTKTVRVVLLVFGALGLFSVAPDSSQSRTWFIKADATGDAATIQAGIDSAASGDTVLLDTGEFKGAGNTDVDFLGKAVTVTSVWGPDFTSINGERGARGFIFNNYEDSTSVLNGVTIFNGFDNFSGGAVFCRNASPTITGNVFSGNQSVFQGGAVYCDSTSAIVTENTFLQNVASEGAGVWCSGLDSATVSGNRFSGNHATTSGAGIASNASSPSITGNVFSANTAAFGAAIDILEGSTPTIHDNVFEDNDADSLGGAIRFDESPPQQLTAQVTDNIFVGNIADLGGAIYCGNVSSPTIQRNTFDLNDARDGSGSGIYCYFFSDPKILNNILVRSTAGNAIETAFSSDPEIGCCDIWGNAGGDGMPSLYDDGGGNFFDDPLFCGESASGNHYISSTSPCAPDSSAGCGLVGARFVGCTVVVGIVEPKAQNRIALHQNVPNPCNPATRIAFDVTGRGAHVTLRIYDVAGALVRTLVNDYREPGTHAVIWNGVSNDGTPVSSGVYFYRLKALGSTQVRKLVLLK